jgi:dihydrofolate reductase
VSGPPSRIATAIIVAVSENGVIGTAGRLPWRLKSEMQHFRRETMGKPVVMGRRTYLSIGKPLAGRTSIVVSRDREFAAPGVLVAASLHAAMTAARGDALRRGAADIAVIGGAEIYAQTLALADRLVITRVHLQASGDTQLPGIDPQAWQEVERTYHPAGPGDDAAYTVLVYRRRAAG